MNALSVSSEIILQAKNIQQILKAQLDRHLNIGIENLKMQHIGASNGLTKSLHFSNNGKA